MDMATGRVRVVDIYCLLLVQSAPLATDELLFTFYASPSEHKNYTNQ